MKKQALTLIGVLSLLLAAGSAFAQSVEVRANVPFDFVVNHTTLPAGRYAVTSVGAGNVALMIRGFDKGVMVSNAIPAEAASASHRGKLVFRCYGDRCYLAQIWTEGSDRGRMLPKSDLESEVALGSTPHDVVLFASVR
jgi:hypothetical protein